jgi:hypothetical protein
MGILKGLIVGLVGFFLFLILPVLGLAFTINNTVLNPQFMTTEVEKLDTVLLAKEIVAGQIPSSDIYYRAAISDTIVEMKPWIDQQISTSINRTYDYLLGKTDQFSFTISTEPLQLSLAKNFSKSFTQSPPPEYLGLSAAQKDQYLAQLQQQIKDSVPSSLTINQTSIGTESMRALQKTREIIRYIHTVYYWLIAIAVALILLLVWVLRDFKEFARPLTVISIITGILDFALFFWLRQSALSILSLPNLPASFQNWLSVFVSDFSLPLAIYSLSLVGIGVILLVASFVFRKQEAALQDQSPV